MPNPGFYGWRLLSIFWLIVFVNLAFPFYGSSVVNAVMMRDLNLDRQTLGILFSLFTIMSGLPGPLVAVCVNRFGVRLTLFAGSLLVLAGAVLMATVVNAGWQAALAFGVVVALGVSAGGIIGAQAGLAKWFVRRRALVLAIISTASAVGGFVASPLLNRVITAAGGDWRMGWWFIAAIAFAAALAALAFIKEKPEDLGQEPDGGAAPVQGKKRSIRPWKGAVHITAETWSYREALSGRTFWMMMFSQLGMSFGYTVFIAHGVVHLQDLGHTREAASWAISMMALAGLISKGIVGALGDRIDPRYLWTAFIALFGAGMSLTMQAGTTSLLVAVSVCLGMGFGGGVVCLASVLSNYYGTKAFASLAGLAIAINTTMSSVTPSAAGWLYDSGYGYQGVFHIIAAWCALGAVTLFFIKPPLRNSGNGH